MLDVALLGCGGGMPMPERYLSSMLLSYRGRKILVDCGEGTQVSMRLLGWGFKTIDIICITHGHGDHIVGLPGLLSTIGNSGRIEPLIIIGPEGIEEIIKGLRVIAPYLPYEINIIENPSETISMGLEKEQLIPRDKAAEIEISTLKAEHSAPCLSYSFYASRKAKFDPEKALRNDVPKVIWNKLQKTGTTEHEGILYTSDMVLGDERQGIKVSLVTDSRPIDAIPEFIKRSDLFICEGTYGDDEDLVKAVKNKHMTFREAAELARAGAVKELLLTHFSPVMQEPEMYLDNAKTVFENTAIGRDRMVKSLNFE
ncbi:MAG: ribonuclease [Clostridia bacterium]|jgi:ribonuclease Z|nr:ribonuclease [Clostridia bacterium]